MRVIAAA